MGREIKRVPLDFDWPLREVWHGFLSPDSLDGETCPSCARPVSYQGEVPRGDGYAPRAQELHDLWYGNAPFRPEDNGSSPLTVETPAVRAFAERNVGRSPEYYGYGEHAVVTEAARLCALWNGMWSHHLNDDDVAALVAAGRLMDFTHRWTKGDGWQPIDPPVTPTSAEVNEWSLRGFGHDAINAGVAIRARCEREGYSYMCSTCDGHGSVEAYPGQRADADAWEPTGPPTGDGWQLWETTSEGSPISPVFATPEDLARWLGTPEGGSAVGFGRSCTPMPYDAALGFVTAGWAPSLIANAGGVHEGAEFVGTEAVLRGHTGGAS